MLIKKNTLLSAAVVLTLTACGGGSSSSSTTSSGKAVDGYLEGSTVLCVGTGATTKTTGKTGDFSFSPACTSAIVVTGGLNNVTSDTQYEFKGTLRAPAGSTVVTPLTTLMADMTPAQTAALLVSLGLPADTDLTKTDPADGKNLKLLKATQAVQQIIQQLANNFGGLLDNTDVASLYANIAKSVASELGKSGAAPLFGADGTVNTVLLNTVATSAVAAVGATNKISVTQLASLTNDIGEQAQKFSKAASAADLSNVAKNFQDPAAAPIDASASTKYLALKNDAISVNGIAVSVDAFGSTGVTATSLTSIDLEFDASRLTTLNSTVGMFLELVEQEGGLGRTLRVIIDKVAMKLVNGNLAIEPATNAQVFVYGHTSNDTDINLTLKDLTFKPISIVDNKISLNFDKIVNKVLASSDNTTKTTASNFTNIKGSFATRIIVSNLNIRHQNDSKFGLFTGEVTGTNPVKSIIGRGIAGTLTVQ